MIPTSRQESQSFIYLISGIGYCASSKVLCTSIKVLCGISIVILFRFFGGHYVLFYATVLKTRPFHIIFKKKLASI